jgi:hypothetical protein
MLMMLRAKSRHCRAAIRAVCIDRLAVHRVSFPRVALASAARITAVVLCFQVIATTRESHGLTSASSGCSHADIWTVDTFATPLSETPDPNCSNSPIVPDASGAGIAGTRSVRGAGTCGQPVVAVAHSANGPLDGTVQVWLGSYGWISGQHSVTFSYRQFGALCLGRVGEIVVDGGGVTGITAGGCCEGEAMVIATVRSSAGSSSAVRRVNGGAGQLRFPVVEFSGNADFTAISEMEIVFSIEPAAYCGGCNSWQYCCSISLSWTVDRIYAVSPPDTDGDLVVDEIDNCVAIPNPSQADCNSDGTGDACDLAAGAPDVNGNGVPDFCECLGDIFVDGRIDGGDLGVLLANWGTVNGGTGSVRSDLDANGVVNGADLGILLYGWGPCS